MNAEQTSQERPDGFETFIRRLTLLATTLIKIAGGLLGLHAGFQSVPDSRVLAFAALMLMGGQLSEGVLLAAIDRFTADRSRVEPKP